MSENVGIEDLGPKVVQELLSAIVSEGVTADEAVHIATGVTHCAVNDWLQRGIDLGYITFDNGAYRLAAFTARPSLKPVPSPTEANIAQRVNIVAERVVQVLADAGEPLTTNGVQRGFNKQRRPLVSFALESLRQAGRVKPTGDGRWRLTD